MISPLTAPVILLADITDMSARRRHQPTHHLGSFEVGRESLMGRWLTQSSRQGGWKPRFPDFPMAPASWILSGSTCRRRVAQGFGTALLGFFLVPR